jgi:hypothetical protein
MPGKRVRFGGGDLLLTATLTTTVMGVFHKILQRSALVQNTGECTSAFLVCKLLNVPQVAVTLFSELVHQALISFACA